MSIHRYTPAGVEELMGKAAVSLAAFPMLVIAGALGATLLAKRDAGLGAAELLPFAILAPFLFWTSWRQRAKTRSLILSTEIEFTGEELIVRNSQMAVTLLRSEVLELRRLNDGLLLRGQDSRNTVTLKQGLEDFESLAAEVNAWVPPDVKRSTGTDKWRAWIWPFMVGNLALMMTAFVSTNPMVAGGASLLEAAILVACLVPMWRKRSDIQIDPKLRRSSAIVLLPVAAMLWRAYLLIAS